MQKYGQKWQLQRQKFKKNSIEIWNPFTFTKTIKRLCSEVRGTLLSFQGKIFGSFMTS